MRTILVTGCDTGVGKTWVTGSLARLLAGKGRVQIVKPVETGGGGDAERARKMAGGGAEAFTLFSFSRPIAPAAAAAADGGQLTLEAVLEKIGRLPGCDWRIFEGAGGIATPIDARDWADFAAAVCADATVIVVPDRLGAINQARLSHLRATACRLHAGIWLNTLAPPEPEVARSTRDGLLSAGVPLWAEQASGAPGPDDPERALGLLAKGAFRPGGIPQEAGQPIGRLAGAGDGAPARESTRGLRRLSGEGAAPAVEEPLPAETRAAPSWLGRCRAALAERDRLGLRRRLKVSADRPGELNLADNDYLGLALDPAVAEAAASAARGRSSASASPLISGWREEHERLAAELARWHGLPHALLWTSGYAANSAVLGGLPRPGDRALADRLVHHSMIAGLLRSGARLRRYPHLDLDRLEAWLEQEADSEAPLFVATESVFSMDGDCPDLGRLAALKRRHGFCLVLDEAHALGWYGPEGSGLAREAGAEAAVDILVGTLGKALASGGAYALFRDQAARDYLANFAGEFVYSTALPPASAAAALAALGRLRELAAGQAGWRARSRAFRAALRAAGWAAPDGDSPIVPVLLGDEAAALSLAEHLAAGGVRAAAVRPPTVPAGTSRLRLSLKRTFGAAEQERVLAALDSWRRGR